MFCWKYVWYGLNVWRHTPNELEKLVICQGHCSISPEKNIETWCKISLFVGMREMVVFQVFVRLSRNPFYLSHNLTRVIAIFLVPNQFVISKRVNINYHRKPYVFSTGVVRTYTTIIRVFVSFFFIYAFPKKYVILINFNGRVNLWEHSPYIMQYIVIKMESEINSRQMSFHFDGESFICGL